MTAIDERIRRIPFRLRLTLSFAAIMVVLFGGLALLLYNRFSASLSEESTVPSSAVGAAGRRLVQANDLSQTQHQHALDRLSQLLFIGGPVALVLTCLAGYALTGRALSPVERMRRRAARISGDGRGNRLPVPEAEDELRRLGTTLNEMLARLEEGIERERAFVAAAGHELRTPLSILKLQLEDLEQAASAEALRAELEPGLRSAAEEVERLVKLAEDLLAVARAQQGALSAEKRPLAVAPLLEGVAGRLDEMSDGREIVVEPARGLVVPADEAWLEQALTNMASNALQHGAGTVVLSARRRRRMVELHVLDDGPGFPPEFLPRAFERFAREDAGTSGGAGLGLLVVRAIAEAHGGEAGAQNRQNGGADVWLTLPTGESAPREGHAAEPRVWGRDRKALHEEVPIRPLAAPPAVGEVAIRPVRSRSELRRFIRLPFDLYRGSDRWVPPLLSERRRHLDRRRNPFFDHAEAEYFLAWSGDRPIGRISAHVDHRLNEFSGNAWGLFGFFEAVDEPAVAHALLDAAAGWLREKGKPEMVGPMDFTTNHECGLLVAGHEHRPQILESWHHPYYGELLESWGLEKAMDLVKWQVLTADHHRVLPVIYELADRLEPEHGITLRHMRRRDFEAEMARFREVYNAAWKSNWGFVPLTQREMAHHANELRPILDEGFTWVAERNGETVGVALALPDYNTVLAAIGNGRLLPLGWLRALRARRNLDEIRVFALGVKPEYRHTGVAAAFYREHWERCINEGIVRAETGGILETNDAMNHAMEALGGDVIKRYRVYSRALAA